MSKSNRAPKPLTHRIGDNPKNQAVLDQVLSDLNAANKNFRRVIDGVLVTEAEYQQWRDNGGARESK